MRCAHVLLLLGLALAARAQSVIGGGGGGGDGSLLQVPLEILRAATSPENMLNTQRVFRPRDYETRMMIGLGPTVQWANLAGSSSEASAHAFPWVGGMVELGASLTYRDRMGMALQGAWGLNGYYLGVDSLGTTIYHTSKRAELRYWWLVRHVDDDETQLKFALALGYTFQQDDELLRDEKNYHVVTNANKMVRPYIGGEIGMIGAEGRDRVDIALRYVVHLDGRKAWETNVSNGTSTATFNASDNYMGIITRYHIGFNRKERSRPPYPIVDHEARSTDTLTVFRTNRDRIILHLWDNAEIDGDTISVLLNGHVVVGGLALAKKPARVILDLDRGDNQLLVIAHNEGRVPPNTASGTIRWGRGKEELLIRTSLKSNQVVVIQRQ